MKTRKIITPLKFVLALTFILSSAILSLGQTAPSITSLSPTVGPVSPVGGSVTIKGSGFGATQGSSVVTFGGITATPSSWSATGITVPVPGSLLPGFADVIVTVNAASSNARSFLVIPVITAVAPGGHAPVGASVAVTGTSFGDTQGANTVTFNGILAAALAWSNTSITFSVPAGATSGPIVVTVNGWTTNGVPYMVSPTIYALSPTSGPVGPAGGAVTLTGSGFGAVRNFNPVTFGGVSVTPALWSDTSITVPVPSGLPAGNANVIVTVNTIASNTMPYVVTPVMSGLSANSGSIGAFITITGTSFGASQGANTVTFNGLPASASSWSDTSISISVPNGATSGPLLVAINGVASNPVNFTVLLPPVISSVTPASGPSGTQFTIAGGDFGPNQGTLTLNGVAATIGSWSNSSITATVPQGATSGNLQVTTASLLASNAVNFTVILPNPVTVTPATAVVGSVISLTGASFGPAQADSTLSLGALTLPVVSWSDGEIRAVIPAGATSGTVLLTVQGGVYGAQFNVIPVPANGIVTALQYDLKGQLISVTDPLNHATSLAYTSAGMIQSVTDALGNITQFQYDAGGNRTSTIDALQSQTSFTYDVMNRLTKVTFADGSTNQFAYDFRGRRISSTDGNGKITSFAYDDADRMISVIDANAAVTQYSYDGESNLVAITDALLRKTAFAYDDLRRVTQTTFPSGLIESYAYDANGNLLSKTDRNGNTITYSYDVLDRLSAKSFPDATGVSYSYDLADRLTQVTDRTGTYGLSYDNLGRLIKASTQYNSVPGRTFTMAYAYDNASNRATFTDAQGAKTTYAHDALNRTTSIQDANANTFGFSYDTLGRRIGLTRPNGVNTNYSYDALSRLLSVAHQGAAGTLDGASYTYDSAGNRTSKANLPNSTIVNYLYDNLDQLTGVTEALNPVEGYSYDVVGNRLSSQAVSSYTYNSSNELTAAEAVTFTYDNNGNTVTKTNSAGVARYSWDVENRLTSVVLPDGLVVSFQYDPFGRRIQKGSTTFVYDGADLVEETDSIGGLTARYSFAGGIDEPLAAYRGTSSAFYEADGIGSITSLTNPAGAASDSFAYDSFGTPTASSGTFLQPFRFTGRELDTETGLYYYRARYYDPTSARFLAEDLTAFAGGINFYSYTGNNPANFVDPSGLDYAVSQSAGTIFVYAPITIYGSGATAELASRWQNYISRKWNGHKWRGCKVQFDVPITADPKHSSWLTASPAANNRVFVHSSSNFFRSGTRTPSLFPGHIGQWNGNYAFGEWWENATAGTVAHEFGHVLGLPDEYNEKTFVELPGFEGDIMGMGPNVTDWDLANVLSGRATACGCSKR